MNHATPATRVLVVEDEPLVALGLEEYLIANGYAICAVAGSGAAALKEIAAHKPDIVLMDINIAGDIDGIETIRRIPAGFDPAVIYLTAYDDKKTLDRARDTKPYGYLLKPFSERELHATIQMVVARRAVDIAVRESEQRLENLVEKRTAELMYANEKLKKEVTERHKAEENLAQLTGQIALDGNNALQAVTGSLTLLKRRIAQERFNETEPFIDSAITAAGEAAKLTRRLLSLYHRLPAEGPIVTLPVDEDEAAPAAQEIVAVPALEDKVALVVEDESTIRSLVLDVLQSLGCRTLHANDGALGLEILRSDRRIDLLVTDIGLPGLSGRKLAEVGRTLRPDLKVLFMTGAPDGTPSAPTLPGMHTMTKPFAMDDLARRIQSMMGQTP